MNHVIVAPQNDDFVHPQAPVGGDARGMNQGDLNRRITDVVNIQAREALQNLSSGVTA